MTKVCLVVFDGLRPDCITPELMPHLAAFATEHQWFRNARSVFPSMTRVATTSIAAGAPPSVHGVVGNAFYCPQVTKDHVLDVSSARDIALADEVLGGRFVDAETLGDALAAAGKSMAVIHMGSAGSAYCLNPRAKAHGHWTFSVHGEAHTQTPQAVRDVVARIGALPPRTLPRFEEIDYGARVLLDYVLPELAPDVAVIWFNEPDTSFHYRSLGHDDTKAVMRHVDAAFGRIVASLAGSDTVLIAASDHGQISSDGIVDIAAELTKAGFRTVMASERDLAGYDFVVTGGNMGEISALAGQEGRLADIAAWLMQQPWTGMVLSRSDHLHEGRFAGTLSLKAVMLDHPRAPDLIYVLRGTTAADAQGLPGLCAITSGDVKVGGGMHGGLNAHELNTVLIVGRPGGVDERICGIIDIAPTILDALGVAPPATMTGLSLLRAATAEERHGIEVSSGDFAQRIEVVERGNHLFPLHGGRI